MLRSSGRKAAAPRKAARALSARPSASMMARSSGARLGPEHAHASMAATVARSSAGSSSSPSSCSKHLRAVDAHDYYICPNLSV